MEKNNAVIKTDTEENWNKAINYIPNKFTVIVYQYKDGTPPKVKLGDGVHNVNELPFLMANNKVKENTLIL